MSVKLDATSVVNQPNGKASGRVIVCIGEACTPIKVEAETTALLSEHGEQFVRDLLASTTVEDLPSVVLVTRPKRIGVIQCNSDDEFKAVLKDHSGLTVIDYTASWCQPCQMVSPSFSRIALENPSVLFLKVDVDQLKLTSSNAGVRAMPTFDLHFNGHQFHRIVGAQIGLVEHFVNTFKNVTQTPLEAEIEQATTSCQNPSIPPLEMVKFFAKLPFQLFVEAISFFPFLWLIWYCMNDVFSFPNIFTLRLLVLYVGLKVIARTPLRRLKLPIDRLLNWQE